MRPRYEDNYQMIRVKRAVYEGLIERKHGMDSFSDVIQGLLEQTERTIAKDQRTLAEV
jgi:predicted CopG family antitoxin